MSVIGLLAWFTCCNNYTTLWKENWDLVFIHLKIELAWNKCGTPSVKKKLPSPCSVVCSLKPCRTYALLRGQMALNYHFSELPQSQSSKSE